MKLINCDKEKKKVMRSMNAKTEYPKLSSTGAEFRFFCSKWPLDSLGDLLDPYTDPVAIPQLLSVLHPRNDE